MTREEAVEAFRLAVKADHEANIPDNATEEMRRTALITGDYLCRLSADHFDHYFDLYERIFTEYLTEQWDAAKVKAPDNKE